jgi:hypothetical protein
VTDLEAFARLLDAIEPWRAHLVLVGGWAHRLHRFHPLATELAYPPLLTKDTDLAFANRAPLQGNIKLALVGAGFTEELSSDHHPPVTYYTLGPDEEGFHVEFLTPLTGSGMKRNGAADATLAMAGITAQKLRHLQILLAGPWRITASEGHGIPLMQPVDLLVANPVAFIVQKLLIQDQRSTGKRAQDLLYMHDTLEAFGPALPALKRVWNDDVRPNLTKKMARQVADRSRATFSTVTDDLREAARIPPDRRLSPERMQAFCELALEELLS